MIEIDLSPRGIGIQVIYNSHTISAGMFADQVFSVKLKMGNYRPYDNEELETH